MNMLKTSLLLTALLTAPVTFSALAQQPVEVARVSVSAIAAAPSVVEQAGAGKEGNVLENYLNAH